MADVVERISIFQDTLAQCSVNTTLREAVADTLEKQYIVWQEDPLGECQRRFEQPAKLVLSTHRTMQAAQPYAAQGKKVCALNFASSVTPGGGVVRGATAQEESICRISSLYPIIANDGPVSEFYTRHRRMIRSGEMGRKNRDDCIFSPGVYVMREDTFDCEWMPEEDWYQVDVITCAAPDLRWDAIGKTYAPQEDELRAVFEKRFSRILSLAAAEKAEVLILGAFGCGAFYNPPEIVVQAFNNVWDKYAYCFETVEFAVYVSSRDSKNYQAFTAIRGIEKDASL